MNIHRTLSDRSLTRLNIALAESASHARGMSGYEMQAWHEGDEDLGEEEMTSIAISNGEGDSDVNIIVEKSESQGLSVFYPGRSDSVTVKIDQQLFKRSGQIKFIAGQEDLKSSGHTAAAIRALYRAASTL